MAMDLDGVRAMVATESGLATLACVRPDGTAALSVINAGLLPHPVTGAEVVALVSGGNRKLEYLRAHPDTSIAWRRGWSWAAVEGPAELVGPNDALPGFDPAGLPGLLRAIFTAAGGSHEDWATFDRVMAEEGRTAILIAPSRIYGVPPR